VEEKEYIYIVKQQNEIRRCKIGITNNLERGLSQYNGTGISKDNQFVYLFTAEVKDSHKLENAVKDNFRRLREVKTAEIYFYNSDLFQEYVDFIKSHSGFVIEIPCEVKDNIKEVLVYKSDKKSLMERSVSRKDIMQTAQKTQNDEFYTRYEDIEKETACYGKSIWKKKVVFCNCDDPIDSDSEDERKSSAFTLFFIKNFNKLKLKKLICLHYTGGIDLFGAGGRTYIFTKDGFEEKKDCPKNFSGSFDDPLSIKILSEEADIVCTNPPFSKAADYWRLLIESGKKFLIISNFSNAVTPAFIPYLRQGLVWTGYNRVDWFLDPKRQPVMAPGFWYTNLPRKNRYNAKKIVNLKDIPENCKYFDDNETLCVDRCWIPANYGKPFAVSAYPILKGILELGYEIISDKQYFPYKNGKRKFGRCLIRKKKSV
jgi:hypothetical protein